MLKKVSLILIALMLFVSSSTIPAFCEEEAFFLTYFKDNGQHGVFLAYSEDGLIFEDLNHGEPIFTPPEWENQNLTRDPSVVYRDGKFHMVWTTNWVGDVFGAAVSTDLKEWSDPIMVKPFTEWSHEDAPNNTWAPEVHWDPVQQHFIILWSSSTKGKEGTGGHNSGGLEDDESLNIREDNKYHRTFYSTTTDFENFSKAKLFFDPGVSQIDANLVYDDKHTEETSDDRWVMVVKHEQYTELQGKNLRFATTGADLTQDAPPVFLSLTDPDQVWTDPVIGPSSDIQTPHPVEGPTLMQVGDEYWLYYDRFHMRTNRFGLAKSKDFIHWTDHTDDLSIPDYAHHGTIFLAPKSAVAFLE